MKRPHKFPKGVPYKKWHAINVIPSAAEGYAIIASIENKLNQINKNSTKTNVTKLKNYNFVMIKQKKFSLNY